MSTKEELKNIWSLLSQSTNIPVLLLAGGLTMLGAGFLNPIFALYFMEKGISFVGLGIIFAAASALSLFLKPVIGHVSDTYGRRKLIVGFSLVISLMTPLYLFIRSVLGLALVHSSRTVLSESSQPAFSAMVGDVAPQEGRATLFGFYSSVTSIVYVVALFGGGAILAAGFSLEGLFYITSAFFLISSIVLAIFLKETIEVRKATPSIETTSRLERFLTGLRNLATDRSTLGLMLYSFFFTFALRVYPVYIPLFVVKVFGIGKEFVGPIVAISWITYAIIQPYGGWLSDKWGMRKVFILLGLALIVLFNFAMAISSTLVWVVVFWALIGIGDGMFRPVMSALIVDIVPPTRRGAYFGTFGSVGGIASIVAPLVYGVVAELYSIRWTFLITSVFYALAMITVGILVKEGKVIGEGE